MDRCPVIEGVGLAAAVTEVTVDAQGLLLRLGRAWVVARAQPQVPEVVEGVGLAAPVIEFAGDAQGLL